MEVLQNLIDSTNLPFLTAFLLGLMTAISPCPLATNITALGFISKEITNKKRILLNGIIYTFGRAISYTLLGVILYFGASTFQIAKFFSSYGERFLGPLLIIIGILMLDFIKIPGLNFRTDKLFTKNKAGSKWTALLMGIVFALAFCPYSGVLYFGMLIPITISSVEGLFLPLIFALATGLPVIIFAWLIGYSLAGVGNLYNKITIFQKWFNRVVAVLFILVGIYYVYIFFT
ncbi:MAG: sulfite exporter TauE/SafE family protein [Bacteroidales bacterium]|nr:sulfite exporter TauE/SafE family protein [Bacteroidales bacterium]